MSRRPSENLVGLTLPSGWKITESFDMGKKPTGGNFSVSYKAELDGKTAFVKALDLMEAANSENPIKELNRLTSLIDFEQEVMRFCTDKRMSRVVQLLYNDAHPPTGEPMSNPLERVHFLICELGEGDIRKHLTNFGEATLAWRLGVLSDVALGLDQLHRNGISHHDVKPSNVILTEIGKAGRRSKLGDLGRVVRQGVAGPYDGFLWPGDGRYAPPEYLYGHVPADKVDRRDAADVFMLGGLMFFLITGAPARTLFEPHIPTPLHHLNWRGRYESTVIAAWKNAQAIAMKDDLSPQLPTTVREELLAIAEELTHPDPCVRGDKKSRQRVGSPVGIDRYQQKFLRISKKLDLASKMGVS